MVSDMAQGEVYMRSLASSIIHWLSGMWITDHRPMGVAGAQVGAQARGQARWRRAGGGGGGSGAQDDMSL